MTYQIVTQKLANNFSRGLAILGMLFEPLAPPPDPKLNGSTGISNFSALLHRIRQRISITRQITNIILPGGHQNDFLTHLLLTQFLKK